MYRIMMVLSVLIRQFYIPNPFEVLGDGLIMNIGEVPIMIQPEMLNWIAEPFVHCVTFGVVGMYYDEGSAPALGSLLYLLFYCVHTFLLWLMSLCGFAIWAVVIILVIYVGCLGMVSRFCIRKNVW